ncbi:MAG: hypothetical protein H0W25_09930 [Acidimicrobiia bacterium]|nr:hypothetical protein [Acidimicrobiia bacterium]
MLKKLVTLSCIALAVPTVAGASPATAKPTSGPASVWVSVGGHSQAIVSPDRCSYNFDYEQRIVVDGESAMMQVASVVPPGRYQAFAYDTCDGYIVYAFGSCACYYVFVKPT